MRLPFRPKLLPVARRRFRYIIIHDVVCQFDGIHELLTDSSKYQIDKMKSSNFILNAEYELPYHFVIDKIGDDYATLVARPLFARCEYDDIKPPYDHTIHIGTVGDFHNENPGERYYQQLAYRVVIPMMRTFFIPPSNIVLHHEISEAEELCPGPYFRRDLLMSYVKSWKVTN